MKKNVLKILIATLIISAILGISIIVLDLWNEMSVKVLATTAIIFGFSIPGLCCSTIYEKEDVKPFSIAGMTICVIGCLYILLLLWGILPTNGFFDVFTWKVILSSIILSSSFGHLSLLLSITSNEKIVQYFKNSTIVLSIIIDILLLIMIIFEVEINWQLITVLAILIVLGTIVTPIMNKLNKGNSSKPSNNNDKYEQLEKLKKLLDSNAITEEEYKTEKDKILNNQ